MKKNAPAIIPINCGRVSREKHSRQESENKNMLADLITFTALVIIFIGAVIHDAFCEENEQYIIPILKDIKHDTFNR